MMMGKEETSLEPYIEKYTESRIKFFYSEYKKRYRPIKNAISLQESSGFVEGNNNKFTSAPWVNSSNVFYMVKYFSQPFQEIWSFNNWIASSIVSTTSYNLFAYTISKFLFYKIINAFKIKLKKVYWFTIMTFFLFSKAIIMDCKKITNNCFQLLMI